MKKTVKFTTVRVVATLQIESYLINDISALSDDLVGEYIKIKSGYFENVASGDVDSIEVVGEFDQEVEVFGEEEEDFVPASLLKQ